MEIHHSPVAPPRFPGPRSKKQQEQTSNIPSRTTLNKNFNAALTEASEVVQELPVPVIASAINLVQFFIRRWRVNAPITLSEGNLYMYLFKYLGFEVKSFFFGVQ